MTPLLLAVLLLKPTLADAERALRAGRYEDAAALAAKQPGEDALLVQVEALRALGRDAEAIALLEPAVRAAPAERGRRLALALALDDAGERARAVPLFERFYDDFEAHRIDETSGKELLRLALAASRLGRWHDASDTFRDAVARSPRDPAANIAWARLFLERHAPAEAARSLKEALALDPRHPEALALDARVAYASGDLPLAEKRLGEALAGNPRLVEAHALFAELAIDEGDVQRARAALALALVVRPSDPRANGLLAAAASLSDDAATRRAALDAPKGTGKRQALVYTALGVALGRARRYADALAALEAAIRHDPTHPDALAELGLARLRSGDEPGGLEALRRAWDVDNFNPRTDNVLRLFEEILPKGYGYADAGPVRLRAPTRLLPALSATLGQTLAAAYERYAAFYRVRPGPITVEVYERAADYAVRTTGEPDLAATAVCFGRLITAQAPDGRVNYHAVLSHELAHSFAAQLARERAPRWLMEGLAEWETARHSPRWRRFSDADLGSELGARALPTLGGLDRWFVRARTVQELVLGYRIGMVAVEFLAEKFGPAVLPRLLAALGEGKRIEVALPAATGMRLADLDAAFAAALRARAHPQARGYALPSGGGGASHALSQMRSGDLAGAQRTLDALLAADPRQKEALILRGDLCAVRRDAPCARAAWQAALVAGADGYALRLRLGTAAERAGDAAAARAAFEAALGFSPSGVEALAALARLHRQAGDAAAEARVLGALSAARPEDPSPRERLVTLALEQKRWSELAAQADALSEFRLLDRTLWERLAQATDLVGRTKDARRATDIAKLLPK